MATYRTTEPVDRYDPVDGVHRVDHVEVVHRRGGAGRTLAIILVLAALVVAVLFATGFWTADVKEGAMPKVAVSGGALPSVDVDSKEVVVGTKKETVEVPTVGVRDNGEK